MPLYEYACDACGARFERIQKFSDPPVSVCPTCGGPVQKLISSPAFQFKGSGWYVTDYARSGQKSGDNATTGSDAKTEAAKDGKATPAAADSSSASSSSSSASSSSDKSKASAGTPAKTADSKS